MARRMTIDEIIEKAFTAVLLGHIGDKNWDRRRGVAKLREDLSANLDRYYESLSNGTLTELSEQNPEYGLDEMKKKGIEVIKKPFDIEEIREAVGSLGSEVVEEAK